MTDITTESPAQVPAPKQKRAKKSVASRPRDELKKALEGVNDESLIIFEVCVRRARNLIKIHQEAHGESAKPMAFLADAHRASLVLAISALDAFVRSFIQRGTVSILKDPTQKVPGALLDKVKTLVKDDGLFEAARRGDLILRYEKALESDFNRRSFQGVRNIQDAFKFVGIDDIFDVVSKEADRNYEKLVEQLDMFSDRRHRIAHRGDYTNLQTLDEEVITKKDAEDCIALVTVIAKTIVESSSKPRL